jgi:hypothetical protein
MLYFNLQTNNVISHVEYHMISCDIFYILHFAHVHVVKWEI